MPLEVNNCCFFVGLRTGSLIIGYLNFIWNVLVIGTLIAAMVTAAQIAADTSDKDTKMAAELTLALLGIALIFVIVNLLVTCLLLVGIHKHKRGYIKAYLIYTCIFIIFAIVDFIASIAKGAPASNIVQNLFSLLFSIYYLVVIRSYYMKMDYTAPVGGE
ncbi:unnamed protein product [Arctia plantaginis]|uniref:Uncharacterized protein n=1 Tax=Arctia plantaginis TaxID=874455 RepID=A0A8S0Z6M3_ARCPL|nr:unnamed protein product [Arctia plantaginis]CAB3228272.1 unnamed protein product [Arctia plantaginis]